MSNEMATVAAWIREADAICALTGAGVSAESGVPTFRDAQTGIWARYDPQDLATPEAFSRDPSTVWKWYRWRRKLVRDARPNPGHHALARLAHLHGNLTLVTQNVDGLHQQAGHDDVVEFHGNLHRNICHRDRSPVTVEGDPETPPTCPRCGAMVRPDVVWFGERIPSEALERSSAAARTCRLFMAVGTSATVYPAAGLAELAREAGARVVEINPEATPMSGAVDEAVRAPAGEALPEILRHLSD